MLEFFILSIASFFISMLSFFSGFGLATLFMPVMAIFLPLPLAIALTALVHFLHNFLKWGIFLRSIQWSIVFRFGILAMVFSFLGAWLLVKISHISPFAQYSLFDFKAEVSFLKIVIGSLLIIFAFLEHSKAKFFKKISNPYLAGAFSGFFGGFSGHQGAFRSLFLLEIHLKKESFIATSAIISFFVDSVRLVIYGIGLSYLFKEVPLAILSGTVLGAMIGVIVGTFFLKKVTLVLIEKYVIIFLYCLGILMLTGII